MVRKLSPRGHYYHEPPYTEEENAEFMRRASRAPVAFTTPRAPARLPSRPPQSPKAGS